MKKKVLFISSTGGHLNELLQLSPLFEKYHDKEIAKKLEYETMKHELTERYIPEELKSTGQYSWNMDFENKQLVVEVF